FSFRERRCAFPAVIHTCRIRAPQPAPGEPPSIDELRSPKVLLGSPAPVACAIGGGFAGLVRVSRSRAAGDGRESPGRRAGHRPPVGGLLSSELSWSRCGSLAPPLLALASPLVRLRFLGHGGDPFRRKECLCGRAARRPPALHAASDSPQAGAPRSL